MELDFVEHFFRLALLACVVIDLFDLLFSEGDFVWNGVDKLLFILVNNIVAVLALEFA